MNCYIQAIALLRVIIGIQVEVHYEAITVPHPEEDVHHNVVHD